MARRKRKNKDLVWLHSHFLYWMGGTKYIFEVITQLKKRDPKRKIVVIVESTSDLAQKQYKKLGVQLISLQSSTSTSPLYWLFLPFFIWRNVQQIHHILHQKQLAPANTVLISSMFPMNVIASLLRYPHLQLCYEPFAFFYDEEFTAHFSFAKKCFIRLVSVWGVPLDQWGTRQAHQRVTLNSTTQATMKEVYQVSAEPVYAGVNTRLFYPHTKKGLVQKYAKKKIVIHSTDYSPVKKTDRMLHVMAAVVKKVPTAQLLITTTIDNLQEKKKLELLAEQLGIADQVEFLGFVPIEDLPQYYSLAQVFVQLASSARSGTTSMALPVKEALACGTPAIRADVGGEDVEDGKSGFLVDPSQEKKVSEKIAWLLRHPRQARKMGFHGKKYITKTYTWQKTAVRIEKSIAKVG